MEQLEGASNYWWLRKKKRILDNLKICEQLKVKIVYK